MTWKCAPGCDYPVVTYHAHRRGKMLCVEEPDGPVKQSKKRPDRLYFVYRRDSDLPLLSGWKDEEAALRYARDYGGEYVIGIDVTYVAQAPFPDTQEQTPTKD